MWMSQIPGVNHPQQWSAHEGEECPAKVQQVETSARGHLLHHPFVYKMIVRSAAMYHSRLKCIYANINLGKLSVETKKVILMLAMLTWESMTVLVCVPSALA